MLTRAQIQRIARRNGIGMQAQERDYIQHLLLWLLYVRGQSLILKGGTALRTVYGGSRYSEGLDFNGSESLLPLTDLRQLWQKTVRGLGDFGVVAEIRSEWESKAVYSLDVRFLGPLFDGRDRSEGAVRVGVNREPEEVDAKRELVTSEYDDVRPFVVTVLTAEQLMAEKIRAVMVRGKPRDLYDLWLMLGLGVRPEHQVIERKLAAYGIDWHLRRLMDSFELVQIGWERDLRHLLPQYVPFETAKQGVIAWLVGI
jgi:predicted nucleotidyltransferase component of viral defense system